MITIRRCWLWEHCDWIFLYCACNRFFGSMRQLCRFLFLMCIWFSAYIGLTILIIEFVFDLIVWLWWMLSNSCDPYILLRRMLLLRKFFIASVLLLSLTTLYRVCYSFVRLMLTFLRSTLQNVIFHYTFAVYTLRLLSLMRRFSFEYSLLDRTFLTRVLRSKHF